MDGYTLTLVIIGAATVSYWFVRLVDKLDRPEEFVREIRRFELPAGQTPKDWARPGVDPMKLLGLSE